MHLNRKLIAFIDIMGFKSLVESYEAGTGLSKKDMFALLECLKRTTDQQMIAEHGPTTCPCAPRINNKLDFNVTQVSDCAIISAEISPAGVISTISHCWSSTICLMKYGVMCRGYIHFGNIHHSLNVQLGSGLSNAAQKEKVVSAFKTEASEIGTPFIEIDREVVDFVNEQDDKCVKEMFNRFTKTDGDLTAIFPFKRFNHQLSIPHPAVPSDPSKELQSVLNVKQWIYDMKDKILIHSPSSDKKAQAKASHYIRFLDNQLVECDKMAFYIKRIWPNHDFSNVGNVK